MVARHPHKPRLILGCIVPFPTFVVISCKAYSDAWHPFGLLMNKFWMSFDGRKVLITDPCDRKMNGFEKIELDQDYGWIENLRMGLDQIDDDYVILSQEDFFFFDYTKWRTVQSMFRWQVENKYDCARLYPCFDRYEVLGHLPHGMIEVGDPLRCTCQMAIWNHTSLMTLLLALNGLKTAADFEEYGPAYVKSLKICGVSGVYRPFWPVTYQCSAISRGKWMRSALSILKANEIKIVREREIEEAKPGEPNYDIDWCFQR